MKTNYYNFRNSSGRFSRRLPRAKSGQFTNKIVNGRLYAFRDTIVRPLKVDAEAQALFKGKRFVSVHGSLFGWVPEKALVKINTSAVNKYLANS